MTKGNGELPIIELNGFAGLAAETCRRGTLAGASPPK
jgi:hypothetical protein